MQLPIGTDNFSELIEHKLDFVDKTLLIKEIIDDRATKVIVLTRPRRFGKTLNLSMLHYFFAAEVDGKQTKGLFAKLKIARASKGKYLRQHQGKCPVIFVSFKDVKNEAFEHTLTGLIVLIKRLYRQHQYLTKSAKLTAAEKNLFQQFLEGQIDAEEAKSSLYVLSELIYKHYKQKIYILIDEYDTPIQSGYLSGYYKEIINFMRSLFGAALKTNPYLEKAIITGILRIAKESLFSDLNNIKVYSLLQEKYSQYFGFTEEEVAKLLKQAKLETKAEDIRRWYNGYQFGNSIVYNPWSIVSCIHEKGLLKLYWVNTSGNDLIRKLLIEARNDFKEMFENFLQEKPLTMTIDENVVFGDLGKNTMAALSLMLMAGYLKATGTKINEDGETICSLTIPNLEVKNLYRSIIKQWLANGHGSLWYNDFLEHLLTGNIPELEWNLKEVIEQIVSVHDVAGRGENFYHGLMLGFIASLNSQEYEIKSNRESGHGRYDIVIIPKDTQKLAIILELKYVPQPEKKKTPKNFDLMELLDKESQNAIAQINQKAYPAELYQRGITGMVKIGIAFCGKRFQLRSERERGE